MLHLRFVVRKHVISCILAITIICWQVFITSLGAAAQTPEELTERQPVDINSGLHQGREELYVAFEEVIRFAGTPWLQLHFADYNLGASSFITITSLSDGAQQRLDAVTLVQWSGGSAYFNGDSVKVELSVAPGDNDIFIKVEAVTVQKEPDFNDPNIAREGFLARVRRFFPDELEDICGIDDRVRLDDARVGRLYFGGCSGWLTSNGSVLTAGHCVDRDPDGFGPLLPDGVLDPGLQIIEFHVPSSRDNGTPVRAQPNDQYPLDRDSVVWEFHGSFVEDTNADGVLDTTRVSSLGQDWAVFRVGPNSNTGLTPYQAYGEFFRLTREFPNMNGRIRITGYGSDNTPAGTLPSSFDRNSDNFTDQTDMGAYIGERTINNGVQHQYQVDTTGGNSGSPVIREDISFAIGIHTNGGCASISSANSGTSFNYQPLAAAIENIYGSNTIYVDQLASGAAEDGTVFAPFNTISEGISAARPGATISIVSGVYTESITITKPVTLIAPVGPVVINTP